MSIHMSPPLLITRYTGLISQLKEHGIIETLEKRIEEGKDEGEEERNLEGEEKT